MSETCRGHLWEKIIVKLFASSWYIFLTYIYDARSHLYQSVTFCLDPGAVWPVLQIDRQYRSTECQISLQPIRNVLQVTVDVLDYNRRWACLFIYFFFFIWLWLRCWHVKYNWRFCKEALQKCAFFCAFSARVSLSASLFLSYVASVNWLTI